MSRLLEMGSAHASRVRDRVAPAVAGAADAAAGLRAVAPASQALRDVPAKSTTPPHLDLLREGTELQLRMAALAGQALRLPAGAAEGARPRAAGSRRSGVSSHGLVKDDVPALRAELTEGREHRFEILRRVPVPTRDLSDDTKGVIRPVGPGRVAGEALVRDVRIVVKGAEGYHFIDARSRPCAAGCERGREFGSPCGRLEARCEVDVLQRTSGAEV